MKLSRLGTLNILKRINYGPRLRPSRDWLVILAIAFTLLLCSVVWNLWTFARVTGGETIGTQSPPPATADLPVDSVNRIFERRAAEEARYRSEYRFVDPSSQSR